MTPKKRVVLTVLFFSILGLFSCVVFANPEPVTAPGKIDLQTRNFTVHKQDDAPVPDESFDKDVSSPQAKSGQKENLSQSTRPAKSIEIRDTKSITAGQLTSVEITNVPAGTTQKIQLPDHSFTSVAFQWSSGDLSYKTSSSSLIQLELADDIQQFEKYLSSDLIEIDSNETNSLEITSRQPQPYIKIDFIQPTPSEEIAQSHDSGLSKLSRSLNSSQQYNRDSGAKYTSLGVISRDEWGANPPAWDPYDHSDIDDPSRFVWMPYYHRISRITVHHTASSNNPPDPAAAVRSFYLYHTYSRGWGDIGYSYLIDQYGRIYEGKAGGDEVYSYHAYTEANAMSTSVSLIGNFEYAYPTSSAQSSLIRFMAEKAALYDFNLVKANGSLTHWLNSGYTVYGHRDTYYWDGGWHRNATACPGYYLNAILPSLTSSAQSYKNSHFGTIKNTVAQVNQDMSQPHQPDILYVTFNISYNASEAQVLALVPSFSGIDEVEVDHNVAKLYIRDWDNGGYSVPPYGWEGYNAPGTFFPPAEGTEDRLRTLLTIFRLDPYVTGADLDYQRELPEIPE